ncbi:MAG: hypothetical protein Q4F84_09550 [Fibrobacter sp.]|nr:hypothetical protein [Fibrobacter sp.]
MGAWGTGLLQDDFVSDVKEEYKILLAYNVEPSVACKKVKEYFSKDICEDDENLFWIAIAYVNWQYGIEDESVKAKTLEMLDDEKYMEVWKEQGNKTYEKRKKVIEQFKNNLLYVKRPRKKVPKPMLSLRSKTAYKEGDVIAYQIGSTVGEEVLELFFKENISFNKKWVLLHVVKIGKRPVSHLMPELDYYSFACVMLYNRIFDSMPAALPDGIRLMKVLEPDRTRSIVKYGYMGIDESKIPHYSKDPQANIIANIIATSELVEQGYDVPYYEIDRTVINTYKLNPSGFSNDPCKL